MTIAQNLGFPRIGERRELKKATEAYWKGDISRDELEAAGAELRESNWRKQRDAGIELIPCNDFSYYDQVLDMSCLLGNVPERFGWHGDEVDLDTMFAVARGIQGEGRDAVASEMTKWFDTNYHYIVPEFGPDTQFKLASSKVFDEFGEARKLDIDTKPVLIGPVTYLTLGKVIADESFDKFSLLDKLLPVYEEILSELAARGAEWVQIDEPIFSLDLTDTERQALAKSYERLAKAADLKLMVATYFGELRDNLDDFVSLPVEALHIDAVRGASEVETVARRLADGDKLLSVGVVNGRNVWRTNFDDALALLEKAKAAIGGERLMVAPSCSLLHTPVTLRNETKLDDELKNWLAFAEEKLAEIAFLARAADGDVDEVALTINREAMEFRRTSERIHNPAVQERAASVTEADYRRASPYAERAEKQHAKLKLPAFPATTIGSFPQTKEVRKARAAHKKGKLSDAEYDAFIKAQIAEAVKMQEELGFDMLVHGEFERNDMVEYFGERLEGFAFTKLGWVQSYGSRYVKPPILFGDISRPEPMTVKWSRYAQSLTDKPMKGMLTGPVTILQWSFVRDDQSKADTAKQIALAIRDEVVDLEKAGLAAIQIDEAAYREGLPLRRADWDAYLDWATKYFRLASSGVSDETQIHTHMCYSEFNDIIEAIADMDADCISIETSRSQMELLDAFVQFEYPNEIGPGVYDIHSPRVPDTDEMVRLLDKARRVIPAERLWVNPDCGLKTRGWEEVVPSLRHMVDAARELRHKAAA